MIYPAVCGICGRPIGVGCYSEDVHNLGIALHLTCLPLVGKAKIVCLGKNVYRITNVAEEG